VSSQSLRQDKGEHAQVTHPGSWLPLLGVTCHHCSQSLPELLVMQTQLNCRAGWEMYWAGVQACPKDVGALHKEGNPIPFLGGAWKGQRDVMCFFTRLWKFWLNGAWLARFRLKWRPPHSEVDLGKGGDVLILTMLHSQRGRPWWQASKVCIETEDKEYCLLCSSWGQELHLTIFIAPRVTKSTDSGEDAVVTSKWKHSPTVLKKPLASV